MFESILGIKKSTFGLDIGYKTLKVVQVKGENQNAELVSCGEVEIPQNVLTREGIKEKQKLAGKIIEAIKTAKPHPVSARIVSTTLPESLVFTKTIDLPQMTLKELNKNIPHQATNFFPIPIEEIYLDWQIVGQDVSKKHFEIIVVAAPKILVDSIVEVVKMAGLELGGLETKPISVTRALIRNSDPGAYLILDIGAKTTGLTCYDKKTIKLTSTVAVGGDEMAKNFDLALKTLGSEITHLIKYYQNRMGETKVFQKILLAGGGANVPRTAETLESLVKIKTEVGMPLIRLKSYNPIYTSGLGSAMKEI